MAVDVVAPGSNRFSMMAFATSLFAAAVAVLLMATPPRAETSFPRDSEGRIIGWTETQGRSAAFELTADGKVARVTASGGLEASHTFDGSERIAAIQYPGGGRETLSYDTQGRISAAGDRLGRQHRFTHSSSGHVLSHTDPAGRVIRFGRVPDRRIYGHKAGDASPVLYRYDASGRLVAATDGTHSVKRTFDSAGRMVRVDYPTLQKSVQYTYDDSGRRTSVTDPDGRRTRYEYAGAKLAAIEIHDGSRFEYTRDGKGRVTSLRYPNGITGRWSYNDRGQVTAITYEARDRSVVAGASYSYDMRGNLLARRDAGGAVDAFQYDEAGQLVGEVGPAGVISYRYGQGGNRTEIAFKGEVVAYRHDAADQVLETGPVKYVHDVNGRLAERRTASGSQKYEFDAMGRLRSVIASDGPTISYEYLPTGQRISRSEGRRKSYFVYDRSAILQELNEELKLVALYVHAPGLDRPLASIRPGRAYYYHADRNGSIIAMSDDEGRVVARYAYDGFGNPLTRTDGPDNPFLFNAREWEPSLGLYYYRARYYDPAIGRFLSPDPLAGRITDPLELNPYVFASNNPLRFKDPLGLSSQENDIDDYDVEGDNLEYEAELAGEYDYLTWRLKARDPRYSTPDAINKLKTRLRALEAEMADAGLAPPKPPNNDGVTINPGRIAEPSINDGTTLRPGQPRPGGSVDVSVDSELGIEDSAAWNAAQEAESAAAEARAKAAEPPTQTAQGGQPGTLRGPNAAAPGNTLRTPPPDQAARPPNSRPGEPSVSDSIDWQLRQPDSVDVAAADAARAAQQPGTLRGPTAAPPGNTLRAPAPGARPPVETLPAGPGGPSTTPAAPSAGPGPRTAAATPSGGAPPAATAPQPGGRPACTPATLAKMGREGAKVGAVAAALGFYTCMYSKSFKTGSPLKTSKQELQDCLKEAGIAALDGFQIGALAVVVPEMIPLLAAHGFVAGSKSIKEMRDEWELDKQSAIDEQAAIDCGSDNVTQNAMNVSWAACDFKNALRLAQLLRSRPPEPSWLASILPNIEKGARAQAVVEPILVAAANASDPAQKKALLDHARTAAEGVPCLVDRVGKAAAPPAATPAACGPGNNTLTDVLEICGPERGTGRLVCYGGGAPHCKNGDTLDTFTGKLTDDVQCRDKGGVWQATSATVLCGDTSKPETCSPASCRPPGPRERAWTCTPAPSCGPPQKVAGLQPASTPDPSIDILDSPDRPNPPDDPDVNVLDSPNTPPRGPKVSALTPAPSPGIVDHGPRSTPRPPAPTPHVNIYQPPPPSHTPPPGPPRINVYEPAVPHAQPPAPGPVHNPRPTPPPPGPPHVNIYEPPRPPAPAPQASPPVPVPPVAGGTGTRNSGSCDTKGGVTTCVDTAGNKCTSQSGFCDPTPRAPGSQPAATAPKPATPSQPLPPVGIVPTPNAPPAKSAGTPTQPLPPLPSAQLTPAGKAPNTLPPPPLPPVAVGPPARPAQPLPPANVGSPGKTDAAGSTTPGKVAALPPAVLPPVAAGPAAQPAQPLPPAAVAPAQQPSQPSPAKTAELPPQPRPGSDAGGNASTPVQTCAPSARHKAVDGGNLDRAFDVPFNGICRTVWRPGQNTHALSIAMSSHPSQGSATIEGNSVIYRAKPGYRGRDVFVLTIRWSNSTGNHQGTATYHVTVQ